MELDDHRLIPISIAKFKINEAVLGGQSRWTGYLKQMVGSRNVLPPPDQGVFEDNFDANMATLVTRIQEVATLVDTEVCVVGTAVCFRSQHARQSLIASHGPLTTVG